MYDVTKRAACVLAGLLVAAAAGPAQATVMVTGPDDALSTFVGLFRPTNQFDETGLSGFEYLISSRTGFREADQYLIAGEDTQPTTSLSADLGAVGDLSGTPFEFSVQHNLVGGRNFSFSLTDVLAGTTSVLCWGDNCAPGSISTQLLNGIAPIIDYNGIQLQVRAQEVAGSSAEVTVTSFTGVTLAGNPLFDEVVTLTSPASILNDTGRRGQWFIGDDLDLVLNEWELEGLVTLIRPDAATTDVTKVRLAIDFVRDPNLPFLVPEPSVTALGLVGLVALSRRRSRRPGVPGGLRGGWPGRDRADGRWSLLGWALSTSGLVRTGTARVGTAPLVRSGAASACVLASSAG